MRNKMNELISLFVVVVVVVVVIVVDLIRKRNISIFCTKINL